MRKNRMAYGILRYFLFLGAFLLWTESATATSDSTSFVLDESNRKANKIQKMNEEIIQKNEEIKKEIGILKIWAHRYGKGKGPA